jgi:hypothetical protein
MPQPSDEFVRSRFCARLPCSEGLKNAVPVASTTTPKVKPRKLVCVAIRQ